MNTFQTAFFVKNLFNYETIIAPPVNLPSHMHSIYLTDSSANAERALTLGWKEVIVTTQFSNLEHKQHRRLSIAYINAYPGKFVPNAERFDLFFVSDSNILRLFDEYIDFVNSCNDQYCLFVTSGWYHGQRDNILSELVASLAQPRWSYFHQSMRVRVEEYCEFFKQQSKNVYQVSVCSAKYFGWNLKHPYYLQLSTEYYNEHLLHLQGNITLSYLKERHPQLVQEHKLIAVSNGAVSNHNFEA
jgi:hypothetical protein